MDYSEQLNEVIAALSAEKSLRGLFQQHLAGNPLPSARSINEIVKLSRAIIFPGYFGSSKINRHTVSYHIGVQVEQLFGLLTDQICAALCFQSADNEQHARATASFNKDPLESIKNSMFVKGARANFSSEDHSTEISANSPVTSCGEYSSCAMSTAKKDADKQGGVESVSSISFGDDVHDLEHEQGIQSLKFNEEVKEYARSLAAQYISNLELIRTKLAMDVKAAFDADPAATSFGEVICCYPGVRAIFNHRIAHTLLNLGVPLMPRAISELAHSETGIDIHPGARIGDSFSIDHGTGVVIGETCIIGKNVKLFQGVTLGAKTIPVDSRGVPLNIPRHPILEDDVVVYSNATILGRITIGRGAVIGGNVWVTEDVKAGGKVVQQRADR
ncbi:serine O-acetyltransferase [Anaerobiospirillum succiniciproducens]|uniref:serine O-acetyltransferase n=1 Tax=Anaerobiospirillum succiniciproducens TaxID=13335 RepID=UPI000427F92E|nr:hypothetical protein [Anaerobiospirillum succiniciproducens]